MSTIQLVNGYYLTPSLEITSGDILVNQDTGRIEEVGETDTGETVIDVEHCVTIPGLINAHTHTPMTLLRGYADDKPLNAWLQEDIWPAEAQLSSQDIRIGAKLAILEMIQAGITAFADMYFEMAEIADIVDQSGIRARIGHGIVTAGKETKEGRADLEESIQIAKKYDDTANGRLQTAVMPHSLTTVEETILKEAARRAHEAGVPLHYHANETKEEVEPIVNKQECRPLEYAADLGMAEEGDFIAHGVHMSDTEIEILSSAGVGVVHCPASNMKLASGKAPVQTMINHGITVGLGTDGAASNNDLDILGEMRDAALLGKLAANSAKAVSAPTALQMATVNNAKILGINSGQISPGKNADLTVLDFETSHLTPAHSPISDIVYAAQGSDVVHTICDGEFLMKDRNVRVFDEETVREQATTHAEQLIDRVENPS
ncbi:MAG: amidohydrolase [Halobacteriaceae archaeon]